jgi:hypothetical protein
MINLQRTDIENFKINIFFMKKLSFISSMFVLAACLTFLLIACQKEQNASTTATTNAASESNIVAGVNGGAIPGLISRADADELRAEYLKIAGSSETQSVQFSISALQSYLQAMKNKYGADQVYITFGVYDEKTAPNGDLSYVGKKTVFFAVNNKKSTSTTKKEDGSDGGDEDFLNHGQIYP